MSEIVQGIALPLFDRLASELPGEGMGMLNSMDDIKDSICRDLHRLLNARSSISIEKYLQDDLSVVNFGLPDVAALSAKNGEDRNQLQRILEKAFIQFEPRLKNISIQVQATDQQPHRVQIFIAADARLQTEHRRVEFHMALDEGVSAREGGGYVASRA